MANAIARSFNHLPPNWRRRARSFWLKQSRSERRIYFLCGRNRNRDGSVERDFNGMNRFAIRRASDRKRQISGRILEWKETSFPQKARRELTSRELASRQIPARNAAAAAKGGKLVGKG